MHLSRTLSLILAAAPVLAPVAVRAQATPAPATQPAKHSLFDPARHMRVSEVRVGMKGYGVSVFKGTKLERFDVEVLAILKNFNPKSDVVLITCHGANLEHTGSIAGMSGSPIYLQDDQGKYRMIGAFAYGWPLTKDPLAGVQPIEYMLDLNTSPSAAAQGMPSAQPLDEKKMARWTLNDLMALMPSAKPQAPEAQKLSSEVPALKPLTTPLMTAGMPPAVAQAMAPIFAAYNMVPLQAGGASSVPTTQPAKLEPGAALAVPLLTGDVDFTAIGTVTEVLGNRIFGFGHSFNNEGPINLPMGVGEIATVVPNLQTSFKLGTLSQLRGTLTCDQIVGIAGLIGSTPPTIPIDMKVHYADGSGDRAYHFNCVVHPRFTPMLAGAAINSAVSGARELPPYHTLNYDITMEFENGKTVHIENTAVNVGPAGLLNEIALPLLAASENPFQRVFVKKVTGNVTVVGEAREARILSINVPRLKLRPGQTVKAYVTYRPFRGAEDILPITFDLPRDLPEGNYQLVVSDSQRYLQDEMAARPFRFSAEKIGEIFAMVQEVASIKHDALYVRLMRQADGVAVGRTAMARMPSSYRHVLLGSGRSNITPYVSSTVKSIPTDYVMEGAADFQIKVDRDAKVESANKAQASVDEKAEKASHIEEKK